MELNKADRSLRVKIAYYGPAVGGKTTNLNVLYQQALGPRKGGFVSINSQQDRTILCDLLPLRAGGFCGFDVKLQLLAVPGQSIYIVSRRAVLKGSDGIVFVANSAPEHWHDNIQSFAEMNSHLRAQRIDPETFPLVFQYNKRDLPQVVEVEALNRGLNKRGAPSFTAVARQGEGVLETLSAILELTLEDLCRRHDALVLPPRETLALWTAHAVRSVFGRNTLSGIAAEDERAGTGRPLKLQIAMAGEGGLAPGGPADSRSPEALAESYAEASTQLALALNDVRLERDRIQARLTEVHTALQMAEADPAADVEDRARTVLDILARAADASNASFFLTLGEVSEILVLPPLLADPLARLPAGNAFLAGQVGLRDPQIFLAGEDPDLALALARAEPPFQGVALVPFRSAERLLGLALLYFRPHAPLPLPDSLAHLGLLAQVLSGPLEATAAREAATDAARLRAMSRASAAAVVSLLTRLPPHALRRQPLALEDLLAPLRSPGVTVEVEPGMAAIEGDAALLRFALATLVHRCEAASLEREEAPEIRVRAQASNLAVQVHVMSGSVTHADAAGDRPPFDIDAELSAVDAILALHRGYFLVPEGEVSATHFTLQFDAV